MATRKIKTRAGREIVGQDIPFRIIHDGAITIELEDGAHIRLRPIVVNVVRTDEKTPEGERVYLVLALNQTHLAKPAKDDES